MDIIYFSHSFVTEKFARKLYAARNFQGRLIKLEAPGPHRPLKTVRVEYGNDKSIFDKCSPERALVNFDDPYIVLFPCYGRKDPHTGVLGNMVPAPVQEWVDDSIRFPAGAVVLGNRTFGSDFCNTDLKTKDGYDVPIVARVEQDGTKRDVNGVAKWMNTLPTELTP